MSTTSPLLPTPRFEGFDAGNHRGKPDGLNQTIRQLPTPTAGDGASSGNRNLPGSNAHPGTSLTDVVRADRLLPTPDAGSFNDGQSIEAWKERGARMKERHGAEVTMTHGTPLGMVVRLISSSEDSPVSQPAPPAAGREPQTIAGSGPSSPELLASWDPATSSWRMFQASLLSTEDERFPRSWERWPTSGMTRRGQAFALPMSERPTVARDSSSLHTPTTGDTNPSYDHRISPGQKPRAKPVPNLAAQVSEMLPTPDAWLGRRPSSASVDPTRVASRQHPGDRGRRPTTLPEALDPLLPTPKTPTGGAEPTEMRRARGNVHGTTLESAVQDELLPTPSARDQKGKASGGTRADGREWSPGMLDLATSIGELTEPPSIDGSE
jgi:hypothetical protein